MTSLAIVPPDIAHEQSELLPIIDAARSIQIQSVDQFEQAGALLKDVTRLRKSIEEKYKPTIEAAHRAHKAAVALCKEHVAPCEQVESVLKGKCGEWMRLERERVAREQAEEQERQRAATEEQRLREEEALSKLEEQRLAQAAKLEAQGRHAEAEKLVSAPVVVPAWMKAPPPATQDVAPASKVAGLSGTERWKAEVVDKMALIRHVAAHPELEHLLDVNSAAINGLARSLKGAFNLPGARAVSELSVGVRS